MLILESLSYQAAKRSFLNSTRKLVKFSINQNIVTTKQVAKVKSPTLLEWEQPISLPLFLNAKYQFEIFQQHAFGYNPQELNSIAGGAFTISEDESFSSWQVISDRGNKMGFLSAKIRRKLRYAPNSTAPAQSQILTISSIITHLSFLKQKRGYIVINVAGKPYKTEITKSKAGELLFTEQIQIEKTDDIVEAKVEVFSFDAKQNKSQMIASGVLKMDPQHPEKKVVVKNEKNQTADVFFDYKNTPKQLYTSSKMLSKVVQRNSLLNKSTVDRISNYSASRTLNQSSLNSSDLKTSRTNGQRPSVVHHNNNVFMPSQKRFIQYVDKPNQNVSYLRERDAMDFKNQHSKIYYKGASIGVGQKFDFTGVFKTNPGVGAYHLPSLWDRY